jgi:serine/threonine protein kinase
LVIPVAYGKAPTLEHLFTTCRAGGQALDIEETVHFCHGVANGLAELHRVRVVHGDIKLSNVLLFEQDGRIIPKLSDFSHSFAESDFFDMTFEKPQYTGTRPFAIPEVRRQESEAFKDDISSSPPNDGKRAWEMEDFYLCDVFGLGLLICSILNGGMDISSRAKDSLARDCHQPDGELIDEYVGRLCESPLGVLTECEKSLALYNSTSDLAGDPVVSIVLEMCLQDDPGRRGSAADVAASISTWFRDDSTAITPQNE